MSEISIKRAHSVPHKHARELAEKIAAQLQDDFGLAYEWHGEVLRFHRDGVRGELRVLKEEIRIDAKLGFLLSFLKPRIEQEILGNLDKLFGSPKKRPAGPSDKTAGKTPVKTARPAPRKKS